jgi:hypothetical protein
MRDYCAIHEPLMNESRMILPRVGGGVGVGGGLGVGVSIQDQVDNLTVGAPLLALVWSER